MNLNQILIKEEQKIQMNFMLILQIIKINYNILKVSPQKLLYNQKKTNYKIFKSKITCFWKMHLENQLKNNKLFKNFFLKNNNYLSTLNK